MLASHTFTDCYLGLLRTFITFLYHDNVNNYSILKNKGFAWYTKLLAADQNLQVVIGQLFFETGINQLAGN